MCHSGVANGRLVGLYNTEADFNIEVNFNLRQPQEGKLFCTN